MARLKTGASGISALEPIDLVALTAAALMAGVIFGGADNGATTNDFRTFYLTARAWRLGLPRPDLLRPDLKPPTFSVLFWPLTLLSEHGARVVWTLLSLAACGDAIRRIRSATSLGPRGLLWLVCGCIAAMPAAVAWQLGQVSWMLLWLVTRAWLSSSRSAARAGAWLGLAIAIQPTLALMALLLPVEVWLAAGLIGGAMSAVGMAITGIGAWREWIALSGRINWLPFPLNASLWGLAARIQSGGVSTLSFAALERGWVLAILAAGAALGVATMRGTGSRRWILAGLWGVLMSPLGWTHYLPMLLGPAIATRSGRLRVLLTGLIVLSIPLPVVGLLAGRNPIAIILLGSSYSIGLCLLWCAWAKNPE